MSDLNVVAAILTIALQSKHPPAAPKTIPTQQVVADYLEICQRLEAIEKAKGK